MVYTDHTSFACSSCVQSHFVTMKCLCAVGGIYMCDSWVRNMSSRGKLEGSFVKGQPCKSSSVKFTSLCRLEICPFGCASWEQRIRLLALFITVKKRGKQLCFSHNIWDRPLWLLSTVQRHENQSFSVTGLILLTSCGSSIDLMEWFDLEVGQIITNDYVKIQSAD